MCERQLDFPEPGKQAKLWAEKMKHEPAQKNHHQVYLSGGIHQFQIGTFDNFTYLILSEGSREALVVDPQEDFEPWENILKAQNLTLKGCLLTHSHWDHVIGIPALLMKYPVPIYLHERDFSKWRNKPDFSNHQGSEIKFLTDGETLTLGDVLIEVFHTPGHSAGELTYGVQITLSQTSALLTGDVVFVGEVGRTDLPTGSVEELFDTLLRLKSLVKNERYGPDTVILSGHDYGTTPASTLAFEIKNSPAFLCKTVKELDALP